MYKNPGTQTYKRQRRLQGKALPKRRSLNCISQLHPHLIIIVWLGLRPIYNTPLVAPFYLMEGGLFLGRRSP
ncbi:hypothetical protein [Scytonema sp. PRP1]|uniref:hypothetical protein n=1 Tax=Scytonema sp. PRP1 TaxID=3120513 RepID=UPI002FD78FE7